VSSRRLARSTAAAVAVGATGLLAAATWAASAERLTTDFRLQGWDFDASVESESPPPAAPFLDDPGVDTVTRYERFPLPIEGVEVDVFALSPERGLVHPTMREGRAPAGPGEIALGPQARDRLGVDLGDDLTVDGVDGPVVLTVVGEAAFPLLGNGGFGETASVTADTGAGLVEEPFMYGLLLGLEPGTSASDLEQTAADADIELTAPFSAPPVDRLRSAIGIDGALVAFFAVFAATVLAFGMIAAARRSSRDFAVVRTLGFRRREVVAAVGWNTALTLVAGAVVGVPLGIALGRAVWAASVRRLGVLDAFTVPAASLGVGALVALAVAFAIALVAARRPARMCVATALRTE
jgi:hypothetical protein